MELPRILVPVAITWVWMAGVSPTPGQPCAQSSTKTQSRHSHLTRRCCPAKGSVQDSQSSLRPTDPTARGANISYHPGQSVSQEEPVLVTSGRILHPASELELDGWGVRDPWVPAPQGSLKSTNGGLILLTHRGVCIPTRCSGLAASTSPALGAHPDVRTGHTRNTWEKYQGTEASSFLNTESPPIRVRQ